MIDNDLKQIRKIVQEENEKSLKPIRKTQKEHSDKIDIIIADIEHVKVYVRATHDLVKLNKEKTDIEIKAIKQHVDLAID